VASALHRPTGRKVAIKKIAPFDHTMFVWVFVTSTPTLIAHAILLLSQVRVEDTPRAQAIGLLVRCWRIRERRFFFLNILPTSLSFNSAPQRDPMF
jgi:hypothetical protein